jgi:hypothetical protein
MRQIASDTLNSGERWSQVYQLNQGWRPEYVVPGGTLLYLPPDARVPAATP